MVMLMDMECEIKLDILIFWTNGYKNPTIAGPINTIIKAIGIKLLMSVCVQYGPLTQVRKIASCAVNAENVFSATDFKGKR